MPDEWSEWKNHVLSEIQRLSKTCESTQQEILVSRMENSARHGEVKADLASLKTEVMIRSGIWGAIAGIIPSTAAVIYLFAR